MDSYRLYRVLINNLVCCCMTILPVDSCAPSLQQILSNLCAYRYRFIDTHTQTDTYTHTKETYTCLLKLFLFITQNELLNSQFMFRFLVYLLAFFSVFLLDFAYNIHDTYALLVFSLWLCVCLWFCCRLCV